MLAKVLNTSGFVRLFIPPYIRYFAAQFLIVLHKFLLKIYFWEQNLSLMFERVLNTPLNPVY